MNGVTLVCYWGGKTCDGPDGVTYDRPPSKAIKVNRDIQFDELVDRIYRATSIDKQQQIRVRCRYPSVGIGKVVKYILLPVKDNDDVGIIFDVFTIHQEVSTLDLYIEVEDNAQVRHTEMSSRIHESVMPEEERSNELLTNTRNATSDMIQNDDFYKISQDAAVSNAMNVDNEADLNNVLEYGIGDGNDQVDEIDNTQEASFDNTQRHQVPSFFTTVEGTNMTVDSDWTVSQPMSKNDFTRELGKDSFKDKEELIRAIKLHCIATHRQFEVIYTRPTIWTIRCKLHLQTGCKWKLHAIKRKRSGYFEIRKYIGPHTCSHYNLSRDHPNLDANLIAMETKHLIKEQPSISIPSLRAELVNKLGYTPSYKKVWVAKQKAIEQLQNDDKDGSLSTRLRNEMYIKEGKISNHCGICRQKGHNRKGCPCKPS